MKTALLAIGLLGTAAAWADALVLTPDETGEYTWVKEPTAAKALALAEKGKLPFVEVKGLADYRPALVDYGPSAAAVAFDQVPPEPPKKKPKAQPKSRESLLEIDSSVDIELDDKEF